MRNTSASLALLCATFIVVVTQIVAVSAHAPLIEPSDEIHAGCGHDDPALQAAIARDLAKPRPSNAPAANNNRAGPAWAPMRIIVSTLDLFDTAKYCTAAGQVRSTLQGSSVTCAASDVLTAAKRSHLIDVVLPEAVQRLRRYLAVQPLGTNLVVGSTGQCSGGFTIPSTHVTSGVAGADFVLYVAAAPTGEGTVAWAGGCQSTTTTPSRIIVGKANFAPAYLLSSTFPESSLRATAVHELMHALGFSTATFTSTGMVRSRVVRGRRKDVIVSPMALQTARAFLNCPTLAGVELEDEGGAGTAYSHLDRRMYKDDIMAGIAGVAVSVVDLAIMQDLGVYQANFSEADTMLFGKRAGCALATDSCTTAGGGFCTYWCSAQPASVGCTTDLRGYGPCTSSPQLTDTCPYFAAYANRHCDDGNTTFEASTGDTFHSRSRCYQAEVGFVLSGTTGTASYAQRCFETRCVGGVLSFRVGQSATWVTCSSAGQKMSYPGYLGRVTCPADIAAMCSSLEGSADAADVPRATLWLTGSFDLFEQTSSAARPLAFFQAIALVVTLAALIAH